MSHLISYKWFRRTVLIPSIGLIYKEVGRLWRMSDRWRHLRQHIGTNATNYFMYQWAAARLPPGGQIRVQVAHASELILYIGPHLTPD